jgi:uncharacterized protein YggE
MTSPRIPTLLLAVVIGGVFYVAGEFVATRKEPLVISVSGEGRVFGIPDIAEVSLGVQTGREKSAEIAMGELQRAMTAVVAAVKAQGIEEKDIRTEQFSLNPIYDWTERGQIFRGYEASQSLRVKVRDLSKVGTVLSAATTAGVNQAGGVTFTIDDPEKLRAEAREEAIREAQEKARVLAEQLGKTLGKLRGFSEESAFPPPMPFMARAMDGVGGDENLTVPAGEEEVLLSVTLTYELR